MTVNNYFFIMLGGVAIGRTCVLSLLNFFGNIEYVAIVKWFVFKKKHAVTSLWVATLNVTMTKIRRKLLLTLLHIACWFVCNARNEPVFKRVRKPSKKDFRRDQDLLIRLD